LNAVVYLAADAYDVLTNALVAIVADAADLSGFSELIDANALRIALGEHANVWPEALIHPEVA